MADEHEWLEQSDLDLDGAYKMLREPDPLPHFAAFFAQQAAESALKGLLEWLEQPFPKIHDIAGLLSLAEPHVAGVARFYGIADRLTRYAVNTRYPDDGYRPSEEEAETAVQAAVEILAWVRATVGGEPNEDADRTDPSLH